MRELHTDELIEAYKKQSEDPIMQVVCILYDLHDLSLICWGVNRIIETFKNKAPDWCNEVINTPLHPAKKLIMQHAEISAISELKRLRRFINRNEIGAFISLQPCLDCVRAIAPFVSEVAWKEDNRHQHEQEIIQPASHLFFNSYKKKDYGLTLSLPF